MNLTCYSYNGGSHKITFTFPLSKFIDKWQAQNLWIFIMNDMNLKDTGKLLNVISSVSIILYSSPKI